MRRMGHATVRYTRNRSRGTIGSEIESRTTRRREVGTVEVVLELLRRWRLILVIRVIVVHYGRIFFEKGITVVRTRSVTLFVFGAAFRN